MRGASAGFGGRFAVFSDFKGETPPAVRGFSFYGDKTPPALRTDSPFSGGLGDALSLPPLKGKGNREAVERFHLQLHLPEGFSLCQFDLERCGDSRLNQREPRQEDATKGSVAPGSVSKVSPKEAKPTTAVGVLPAGASPQSGVFPARPMSFENKPELHCEGDDKYGRARRCRAFPEGETLGFGLAGGVFRWKDSLFCVLLAR